jgi:DNA polymerase III alpha subunit
MKLNNYNEIIVEENDLVEAMLAGKNFEKVVTYRPEVIDQFNHFNKLFKFSDEIEVSNPSIPGEDKYSYKNANNWHMPEEYKNLDLDAWLAAKVMENSQTVSFEHILLTNEWKRVYEELEEFKQRDMIPVLKFLVYMVRTLTDNNILWGVGRGSSVSSYILYLIGVHRIDSIKYNLDYKEFLR